MNKWWLLLLLSLFAIQVHAQKNSISLLAVLEGSNTGSVVNLNLDVADGSGRVFLETYPLSQLDTQISLRVAKTIACQTSGVYCLSKDFLYSLQSSSPVVAGPSAGAAITILTMATLDNKKLDPSTVITGTINSGGVIGVVGGVQEKIGAAAHTNMKRVLIPRGEDNASQLIEYGKSLNVTVIEVSNVEDAYAIFTGVKKKYPSLTVDANYASLMEKMSSTICQRTVTLLDTANAHEVPFRYNASYILLRNLSDEAASLLGANAFYSAASRCFGANVLAQEIVLVQANDSGLVKTYYNETQQQLDALELSLNATNLNNLGKLETVMTIQERIFDARNNLKDFKNSSSLHDLAYAIERTNSAIVWEQFLSFPGKTIDTSKLKEGCSLKLNEVQELYNYISLYMPALLQESKQELDDAKSYAENGDYALCLFKASKSKAEIDAALSTLYVDSSGVTVLLDDKINAAKLAIQKEIAKGTFPVLGYSYYEYANTLKDKDAYSALLYAEYGIELSNLDVYFPISRPLNILLDVRALMTLIAGFIIGWAVFSLKTLHQRNKIVLRRRK